MSKQLIIAEKPSVAADLARVLGKQYGKLRKDEASGGFSNDRLIITSAVGHLLEQKKPQTKDGKSLPWKMEYLPVMPKEMDLEPIAKSADRLRRVLKLARSREVDSLVNACDAGREGELIFRNIIRYGRIHKPLLRLWMQSMTDEAILEAWGQLKKDEEMQSLADAALCRSESDWLVGLNSTRALTVLQSSGGGFHVTPTGRVQTPTLAILAERQKKVLAFQPETYYEVHAEFRTKDGEYSGKWFDTKWKKDEKNPQRTRERIWNPEQAEAIVARCKGKEATVQEKKKPVSIPPPLLFDLTSLQKEASNRFGFSASRTLQLAQELYERHKVLTYPRTDSKFLPNDYLRVVTSTLRTLTEGLPEFSSFARDILDNKWVRPSKRVFDSSKVSDHFAIIPTGKIVSLSGDAARIFNLVVQRFLSVFMPNAEFEDTERLSTIRSSAGEDTFITHGRVQLKAGWRALLYTAEKKKKDELCRVNPGEKVQTSKVEAHEEQTKPPAAYTEATLLTAMENAGKLVDDDELASAMKDRGLGTPATRASIIEGLLAQEYIARDGKDLVATRRGMDLIDLLDRIGLSALSSPELTGDWEYRLKQMEIGKLPREQFMRDIRHYAADIVKAVRDYMSGGEKPDLPIACPSCGAKTLSSGVDGVACKKCNFHLRRIYAGLNLDDKQMTQLITKKELPPMDGFRSKFGKSFRAGIRLLPPPQDKKVWHTEFFFEDEKEANKKENSEQISLGKVPVKERGMLELFETEKQWNIPDFECKGGKKKGFSVAKNLLNIELSHEVLSGILKEGKSELITGFVSQRTHKPFDAYLVLDEVRGGLGFEFPPRERKSPDSRAKKRGDDAKAGSPSPVEADLSKAKSHGVIQVKSKGEFELLEAEDGWHVRGLTFGKNGRPLIIAPTMCGVKLDLATVTQLLTKGKSALIKDFVSRRSGKKFEAHLVFDARNGRVTYEFPPRK